MRVSINDEKCKERFLLQYNVLDVENKMRKRERGKEGEKRHFNLSTLNCVKKSDTIRKMLSSLYCWDRRERRRADALYKLIH